MTDVRKLTGSSLILLAIAVGVSLLANTSAAKPENSSGISVEIKRQSLVEPAFQRAIEALESLKVNREKVPAELVLPSGLPEGLPQQTAPDLNLTDGVDVREEIDSLIVLYADKYEVDEATLRWLAEHESTYNPDETGDAGERGVCQFLGSTWQTTPQSRFGWDAAYHPAVNIEACAWMLSQNRANEFTTLR